MYTCTELVLVRHGEAHCNRDQTIQGLHTCQGLIPRGRDQVRRLADRLCAEAVDRPFRALYASPVRRAHETAALIGHALGLTRRVEPDLREPDYGAAEGLTWREALDAFNGIPAAEPDCPLALGAETWRHYLDRAKLALSTILERHPGERILVIGHGETIVAAAALFLGLPADHRQTAHFAARPASITRWQQQPLAELVPTDQTRWVLLSHNEITEH
ncbi:MAG: histidine phosphatase family protein [Streptosporangiales bacterium]|nr:histidine phosphatase family protein [Streptosporangiales bacterium]